MKPYKFIRTVIIYGDNEDDAAENLQVQLDEGDIETIEASLWDSEGLCSEYPEIDMEE